MFVIGILTQKGGKSNYYPRKPFKIYVKPNINMEQALPFETDFFSLIDQYKFL